MFGFVKGEMAEEGEFTVEVLFVLFGGDMWFGKSGFGGFQI